MTDIGRQAVVEHIGQAGAPGPGTVLLLGGAGGRLGVLLGRVMPATEREDETAEMQLVLRIDTILPAILLVAGGCRNVARLAIKGVEDVQRRACAATRRVLAAEALVIENAEQRRPDRPGAAMVLVLVLAQAGGHALSRGRTA